MSHSLCLACLLPQPKAKTAAQKFVLLFCKHTVSGVSDVSVSHTQHCASTANRYVRNVSQSHHY